MPSIPQSLLWVSLVVLWLFVLVPMLIGKRDAVRRTSDVALATRVLNSATGSRLLKRAGPAAGHRSDPHWQPETDHYADIEDASEDGSDQENHLDDVSSGRTVVTRAAAVDETEPEYLDVDIVEEDSGALPAGRSAQDDPAPCVVDGGRAAHPVVAAGVEAELDPIAGHDGIEAEAAEKVTESEGDCYEYVDDTSGLEAEEEPLTTVATGASRRRRYDSKTAAAVTARKYSFRKRVLMVMALVLVISAAAAFTVTPAAWWLCGTAAGVTLLYLAYLRRQTRIEEQLRRRRMQRAARSRLGVENTRDPEFDVVPSRLRRPGAVVLEIDDEDPIFEHLDPATVVADYDLPRAAGQ